MSLDKIASTIFLVFGLVNFCGGIFNWKWLVNLGKDTPGLLWFGEKGQRVFLIIFGVVSIITFIRLYFFI